MNESRKEPINTRFENIPLLNKTVSQYKIALTFVVILTVVTAYLIYENYQLKEELETLSSERLLRERTKVLEEPTPAQSISELVEAQKILPLPQKFVYKSNGDCNVSFPIPPKEDPYTTPYRPEDKNYDPDADIISWNFSDGRSYPFLLSMITQDRSIQSNPLLGEANAMYSLNTLIEEAVSVNCIPNKDNLNSGELLIRVKEALEKFNSEDTLKLPQFAQRYTIVETDDINKWEKDVIEITLNGYYENLGGNPYEEITKRTIFATQDLIYEVVLIDWSRDEFVKQTAQQIFDNLIFE